VIVGEDKLLVNSDRELLTLDTIPEAFTVTDNGFDLCRFSKEEFCVLSAEKKNQEVNS
jgi:hypothetical protein